LATISFGPREVRRHHRIAVIRRSSLDHRDQAITDHPCRGDDPRVELPTDGHDSVPVIRSPHNPRVSDG
jgi:hypothetical protein